MTDFVVARVWNKFGPQDFLAAWHPKYGTVASALPGALRFSSRALAEAAAARAGRLVPAISGGALIEYRVLEIRNVPGRHPLAVRADGCGTYLFNAPLCAAVAA